MGGGSEVLVICSTKAQSDRSVPMTTKESTASMSIKEN